MATIAVLGTLDTKGHEHAFVADLIRQRGHQVLLIDVGTGGAPQIKPDITRDEVAQAAGVNLAVVFARKDRGECVSAMVAAAPVLLLRLYQEGRIHGVISLGGGGGTSIASAAMRGLPFGVPKVIVSTMASGNTAGYIGTTDITLMPSIVDVNGLNRISKLSFTRAAGAICGMVEAEIPATGDKPLIVASMFGNTSVCVTAAIPLLEAAGYEVLVFHANGTGGRAMEALIESGMIAGVLDVTTTELADELVGGIQSAGPGRLTAAGRMGVPAIVVPGCLDMVNFAERGTIPGRFDGRTFYVHNPQATLMRTTPEECTELGRRLATRVNAYSEPTTVLLPRQGISVISAKGGVFYDPAADDALFSAITKTLRPEIKVASLDCAINDPAFARACAEALLENLRISKLQHTGKTS